MPLCHGLYLALSLQRLLSGILLHLLHLSLVTVALHGIDATKELLTQLGPAAADCTFSTVIFNFPHLGVEDARLHGAMVAHVMMRARELLLGSGGSGKGFFVLALADAQAERWKVNDMAIRNNMPLFKQFTFLNPARLLGK